MDEKQKNLARFYASLSVDELLGLIGRLDKQQPNEIDSLEFPSRLADFKKAGEESLNRMMSQLKEGICGSYEQLNKIITVHEHELRVIEWAGSLADVIIALKLTGGYPPYLIAVTLGKLSGWSLERLCQK
jgi:hypothetical protein